MKRILITGKNSYVGNNLERWLMKHPNKYQVDKISLRDGTWKERDFSPYDSIVHVAGIAHVSKDPKMEDMYYKVNRDLTIEVAKKAENEKVEQFIFMSSIIIYATSKLENGVIYEDTIPVPADFYGQSKLEAEKGIKSLENNNFKVAIIRPPMIYGKDSKGNYPRLAKLARKTPIFPDFDNKRSMLHIDNLNEFLKLMIDNVEGGIFFPQNKEYVRTSEMVRLIAEIHGRKIWLTKLFNPIIRLFRNRVNLINKVFGDLVFKKDISEYKDCYYLNSFKNSLLNTEGK